MMDAVAMVVQTCVEAIGERGDAYGLRKMQGEPVSGLKTLPDGTRSIHVKVEMIYDRRSGEEVREAIIVCRVLPNGKVQVLTPDEESQ